MTRFFQLSILAEFFIGDMVLVVIVVVVIVVVAVAVAAVITVVVVCKATFRCSNLIRIEMMDMFVAEIWVRFV